MNLMSSKRDREVKNLVAIHLLNDFSGSPKVLAQVIQILLRNNLRVTLFTGDNGEGCLSNLDVELNQVPYKWSPSRTATLFSFLYSQIILIILLIKYRKEYAIIYVNTLLPCGAAIAGKICRKQVIFHLHETSLKPRIFKRFLTLIARATASKLIYVSEFLALEEPLGGIPTKVIYNALPPDYEKVAQDNELKSIVHDSFNVLMACSMKEYKGVHEFLEIANLLIDQPTIKFTLILNASEAEVENFTLRNKVAESVKVLPRQTSMHGFYKEAHLVLNLSRPDCWVETFGLTILEAMAYGIPVIVPPVGGPAEIVTENEEGFLMSCYKTAAIATKIHSLSKNPEGYERLSKNAKQRSLDFKENKLEEELLKFVYDG